MLFIVIIELITGIIILKYVHGFIKAWRYPKPVMSCLHQEVKDLMQATKQIKEGWSEVIGMVDQVRDRQSYFFSNIQTLSKSLCESRRLEMGDGKGNLVPREQARLYVDTVDDLVAKLVSMRQAAKKQAEALVDKWPTKNSNGREVTTVASDESIKDAVAVVKKVLKDFLKDNRKNIKCEKEDMKKSVRGMTDSLKESIVNAFSGKVASQKNQEPGVISTEKHERAHQLSTKMLGVEESLKIVEIDVSSTKGILDTIDGQLDEIYGKLELDKKAMSKQCREATARMTATVEDVDRHAKILDETGGALAKVMAELPLELQKLNVEEVSDMLHHFATRVEVPMKKLVCNMRFLYETMVCHPKRKNHEMGDVPDEETQGVKMAKENVRSLLKDFRMRSKSQKGLSRPLSALDFFQTQAPHLMRQSVSLEMRGGAFLFKSS